MVLMDHNACFSPYQSPEAALLGSLEPQPVSFLPSSPRISGLGGGGEGQLQQRGGEYSCQILQTAVGSLAAAGAHTLSWFINESAANLLLSQCPTPPLR